MEDIGIDKVKEWFGVQNIPIGETVYEKINELHQKAAQKIKEALQPQADIPVIVNKRE